MVSVFKGFILSSARTLERNACSEFYYLLTEKLQFSNDIEITPIKEISGLSIAHLPDESDPVKILQDIRNILEQEPATLRYVLKVVPVQYRTSTNMNTIIEGIKKLAPHIKDDTTWKIELRRRHTQITRDEVIKNLAKEIPQGKVQLSDPELTIIVEIIGKWTYLGLSPISELQVTKYQTAKEDEFSF